MPSPRTPHDRWTREDLNYPPDLPVVQRREDLLAALDAHQVVVVAGETGSGKTTQLPKMCLEIGRGRAGMIGHTQPRRIAARSVAERLAAELGGDLGATVGYQVRFTDRSSRQTQVKVMTDGILLAELQHDPDLRRYDTIIVDEAHERSLTIDFLLGYLKQLLPRRRDLKVIITSATIDPERLAAHFTDAAGEPAPIIEVSGRTYPVQVRYRPLVDPDRPELGERDQVAGICDAVEELWTEPPRGDDDILIFLSGEREIRDAADALQSLNLPRTEVLPLYARLSAAEQHRVFTRGSGRRIVLATNVAETSLTVPGIGYVVDTGTARISRYSQRTKVQRLPIEPISKASARQRSGRCGRTSPGVAIRLYAEADFEARPDFTEPEILRTGLAAVILRMAALGLGDIATFPFVEAPDPRQVADGIRLLDELGAVRRGARGQRVQLTRIGRLLSRMPVDPRLGRMIVAADELGCTAEVLVIAAALSIQDPRERPAEAQTQADQAHARFRDPTSDFAGILRLWDYLRSEQKARSSSAFRRMCKAEYLHYLRVREWQDVHSQLREAAKEVRLDPSRRTSHNDAEPDLDQIHRALLSGLLSHVGLRDERRRDYEGARAARFSISPGSALFRKQPDYVMAAELVETTRVWAHTVARIDPEWAEAAGRNVVKRTYSEPRWSRSEGAVLATERVTLYGVPLVVDRTIQYARVDPALCRELFLRHALVEGDWDTRHAFWRANEATIARVRAVEERTRRRDLLVEDAVVYDFYAARIPDDVTSVRHFDTWWKQAGRAEPDLLTLTEDALIRPEAQAEIDLDAYPRLWRQGEFEFPLSYEFEPGRPDDGVSVRIPLDLLNRVSDAGFDWLVPGLREDLAIALLKALPKATRRLFVPVPDTARAAVAALDAGPEALERPFTEALGTTLHRLTGHRVPVGEWDADAIPAHLRMRFVVVGQRGRPLDSDRDLDLLRDRLAGRLQRRVSQVGAALERTGLTRWDVGDLPLTWSGQQGRHEVVGYPTLIDRGSSVDLRILPDPDIAAAAHRLGVRRLLLLATNPPWKRVLAGLSNDTKLALAANPHGSVPALLDDALAAAVDHLVADRMGAQSVRTETAFDDLVGAVRTHAATVVLQVVRDVEPVLALAGQVDAAIAAVAGGSAQPPWLLAAVADLRAQRAGLVGPGFIARTGSARLVDLRRYLRAMLARLDRVATNGREPVLQESVDRVETAYNDLLESLGPQSLAAASGPVADVARMIEELRVSLFAQSLGTAYPISEKRVLAAIAALRPMTTR